MNPIGRDLKLLRIQKKLSLEEVHHLTKIPMIRLEGIEDGKTFIEFAKEPTVLRSFIRGYGKALGFADEQIVQALDLEKAGRYTQELIEWVEKSKSRKASQKKAGSDSKTTKSLFEQPPLIDASETFYPPLPNIAPEAPPVEQIDWASKRISNIQVGHSKLILYIIIALVSLIILSGAVWGISRLFSGNDEPSVEESSHSDASSSESTNDATRRDPTPNPGENASSLPNTSTTAPTPAPQTSSATPEPTTSITPTDASPSDADPIFTPNSALSNDPSTAVAISQPPAPVTPSTPFEVLIYAHNGPVGSLQFSVDEENNRRNVRLAQGEAFRVLPDQEIRFDGAFSSMIVFINGEPIDNFQELFFDRRLRQVVLSRELVDGLTNTNPRDLLLPQGVTPPSSIRELP